MDVRASLQGATVVLGDRAILRDVDIDIPAGVTVIRGANGAGKTTLLRALAGLVPLSRGARAVSVPLLYVGDRPQLLRGLSARENLEFFLRFRIAGGDTRAHDASTGGLRGGVGDAVARWGVDPQQAVETLSAGQRRRAALARMDTEPMPLVLLDEPYADLDDEGARLLDDAIARAAADGRRVVIATHGRTAVDDAAVRVAHVAGAALS